MSTSAWDCSVIRTDSAEVMQPLDKPTTEGESKVSGIDIEIAQQCVQGLDQQRGRNT